MERNKLWSLLFAFIPGAGQMYYGLKRRGTEIMILFVCLFFFLREIGLFSFSSFAAVVWFYSFFDTLELRRKTKEERELIKDGFLFSEGDVGYKDAASKILKNKKVFGWSLVVIGAYMMYRAIYSVLYNGLYNHIHWFVFEVLQYIPTMFLAVVLIVLGRKLLKNKTQVVEIQEYIETEDEEIFEE